MAQRKGACASVVGHTGSGQEGESVPLFLGSLARRGKTLDTPGGVSACPQMYGLLWSGVRVKEFRV